MVRVGPGQPVCHPVASAAAICLQLPMQKHALWRLDLKPDHSDWSRTSSGGWMHGLSHMFTAVHILWDRCPLSNNWLTLRLFFFLPRCRGESKCCPASS